MSSRGYLVCYVQSLCDFVPMLIGKVKWNVTTGGGPLNKTHQQNSTLSKFRDLTKTDPNNDLFVVSGETAFSIMVVAILVNRLAPSSRGFERFGRYAKDNGKSWTNADNDGSFSQVPSSSSPSPGSGHRKKPFRAVSALTSLAADLDVISDWVFFAESLSNDREYRQEHAIDNNAGDDQLPYLIPPILLTSTLVVCILGTIMWLILATDGRLVTPLFRWVGYDKLSIGLMLFLCVLVEDIPQVVLTFLIEDYYEDPDLSGFAVLNLTMSLYDTLIKLAEAYDERYDVVETGKWCKESLWAHHDTVTSIITVPLPPSTLEHSMSSLSAEAGNSLRLSQRRIFPSANDRKSTTSILSAADEAWLPMPLPRLRFLTTSLDKTVRFWDTAAKMAGHRRDKCIQVYRGHTDGVTCVALLGRIDRQDAFPLNPNPDFRDEEADHTTFFVTGCRNGNAKLWNLFGDCLRSYYPVFTERENRGVTSIVPLQVGTSFVCCYQDGSARLWEAWSGLCIAAYRGHSKTISCGCSLLDGVSFLTGSRDTTIKLWDTTEAMESFSLSIDRSDSQRRKTSANRLQGDEVHDEVVCKKSFQSSPNPSEVLCIACIEKSKVFVAGTADCIARIWSIATGECLREFTGHSGPVSAVAAVDPSRILTGSHDCGVKLWDVLSGVSLRTYEDHQNYVSDIAVADDEHTFLTASADRTVKMWVTTSVPVSPG